MNWPEAFAIVGGCFAIALLFIGISGGLPSINIHKHYHNTKKK